MFNIKSLQENFSPDRDLLTRFGYIEDAILHVIKSMVVLLNP